MSNDKNNPDINQQLKDSKRNPYSLKENTTDMTENTHDQVYTQKSSNQALDSHNNNQKNFNNSSNSLVEEYNENNINNDSSNKRNLNNNKNKMSNYSPNISYENNMNNEEYSESLEEPLYIMTLELERGRSEKLRIYPNSDPYLLAVQFCQANSLEEDAVKYLTSEIENLINKNKFSNGDESNYKNENLDNTQEEFNENYNQEEGENYNGNVNYDYGNNRNNLGYSNNSRKSYNKHANIDEVGFAYNNNNNNNYDYENKNSCPGFALDNKAKNINRNSKENFYINNPEMGILDHEENISAANCNSNSNRKMFVSDNNIPTYLVHEQITEVDEENNITIEKLKLSRTENDNISGSPLRKETSDLNDFINEKNYSSNNSNLIHKVIKDEEFAENYLNSSGKSIVNREEYNNESAAATNQIKSKKSEKENISRSQENFLEKDAINNINCHSNYSYFKHNENNNETTSNVLSHNDKSRIVPNDIKYSDNKIYLRGGENNFSNSKNSNNNSHNNNKFNGSLSNKNGLNSRESVSVDKGSKEAFSNANDEEKFFTFKQKDESRKETKLNLNSKNKINEKESLSSSNYNVTFKDDMISSNHQDQDYPNDLNYDYNKNMNSDLNKTVKKNKFDLSNTNVNPLLLNQFNYGEKATPLKIDSNKSNTNTNSNRKSSEKLYYIADTTNLNLNNNNKQSNSKVLDTKSGINLPKCLDNYNSNDINNNIRINDYHAAEKRNNNTDKSNTYDEINEKVREYDNVNKNNKDGRSSRNSNSSLIKRPNSRSKYQPLAERISNNQENISNSKIIANNNNNRNIVVPNNYEFISYMNINNKILNFQESEKNLRETKELSSSNKINNNNNDNNLNVLKSKESKRVFDNSRIIVANNKIMEHSNINNQRALVNHGPVKDDLKKRIDNNVDSNNINNFISSIENEITSIKGTQSSNNDRYDKDNKDKSDLNNLNNLNNLIKVTANDKRNEESDIISNNNINNTDNTHNLVYNNTKSNISNINEHVVLLVDQDRSCIQNEKNHLNNLNENRYDNHSRNIVYAKAGTPHNLHSENNKEARIESPNKKVYFCGIEDDVIHKDLVSNEKSSGKSAYYNQQQSENIKQNSNALLINYVDNNNIAQREGTKRRKIESAYNQGKLYNKDRIVSIHEHICAHNKPNLKRLNIFDRLYKEAEIKRILPKKVLKEEENEIYARNNSNNNNVNINNNAADPNCNFGEILYAREKISKEEKEKKLMQIKYEQDVIQMKNLTFSPEIHEYNVNNLRYLFIYLL